MPLDEVPELTEVDEVLDGLSSPTSLEVYAAMLPYSNDAVAAAAARRAVNGGGESGGSSTPLAYLGAFNAVNFDLTNLAVAAAWDYPADLLIGSDISLSSDGLTFTIETDGWYEFALSGIFLCTDATTKGVGIADIAVTPNGASPVWDAAVMPNSVWAYVNGAVMNENAGAVTCPATHLPAGSTFQVTAYYNDGASGAPIKFSGTFLVIRVA